MKQIILLVFLLAVQLTVEAEEDHNHYRYKPMIYEDGWKQLSKDEINARMQKPIININTGEPFDFKVINKDEEEVGRVNTPSEYDQQIQVGNNLYVYTTYDVIDEGLFRDVAMPIIYLSKAKPSKHSYVRNFTFEKEDPLSVLPATFVLWVGSNQREIIEKAVKENKSWRSVSPNAKIIKADKDKIKLYDTFDEDCCDAESYKGNEASHILSLKAMGDFNHDGYEDILISYARYSVLGTGRFYGFVVLTKESVDAVFKDITDDVYKLWENQ